MTDTNGHSLPVGSLVVRPYADGIGKTRYEVVWVTGRVAVRLASGWTLRSSANQWLRRERRRRAMQVPA